MRDNRVFKFFYQKNSKKTGQAPRCYRGLKSTFDFPALPLDKSICSRSRPGGGLLAARVYAQPAGVNAPGGRVLYFRGSWVNESYGSEDSQLCALTTRIRFLPFSLYLKIPSLPTNCTAGTPSMFWNLIRFGETESSESLTSAIRNGVLPSAIRKSTSSFSLFLR